MAAKYPLGIALGSLWAVIRKRYNSRNLFLPEQSSSLVDRGLIAAVCGVYRYLANMKIIFVDKAAHPFLGEALHAAGHEWEDHADTPREEVLRILPRFDGLMVRSRLQIDKELLDAHPGLAFVARWGVGTEHIDLDYAREKGIKVYNSPEGSRHTVAEHTVGMMLMLLNHLARADRQIRAGKWIRRENTGTELGHLTVGLIGYGNMGRETARRLSGFGCRVMAHDKFLHAYGDEFAEAVSLEQLQAEADVVSLHLFLEGNVHYVNEGWIDAFAKPFYLINTARGLAVNTEALLAGLVSGKIKGAALDVVEYEDQSFTQFNVANPPTALGRLMELDEVILTPHIAGWSFAAEEGHARTLWRKISEKAAGL